MERPVHMIATLRDSQNQENLAPILYTNSVAIQASPVMADFGVQVGPSSFGEGEIGELYIN